MNGEVRRKFMLGDEWIYYKIYSGPKTAEHVLVNDIWEIFLLLKQRSIVDEFFFIRYTDPGYHIRVRFHLIDISQIGLVIQLIRKKLSSYLSTRLISNIEVGTYNREIERYGASSILEIERFFCVDSFAIMSLIKNVENNEEIRWLWGVKCMDALLDEFGFLLDEKAQFYDEYMRIYSTHFGLTTGSRTELDRKYRIESSNIGKVINDGSFLPLTAESYVEYFKGNVKEVVRSILFKARNNQLDVTLNDLLKSIMHMHFNRLFRTKQRTQEFVIYYMMSKFYKSKIAQMKYSKSKIL